MIDEDDINRIAAGVVDEIETRGATIMKLQQRVAELEEWGRNEVSRANATADHMIAERDKRIAELERQLEELRCHDLSAFHDGELSADRAAAFRDHLAGCGACAAELHNLIQAEIAVGPKRKR